MEYFKEIEIFIKKNEISKKARILEENQSTLENYWHIGRLLVEAQGENRAKYGDGFVKEWAEKYTKKYGKGYDYTNLTRFKKLYLYFPILGPVAQLSWTNIIKILPIKDENKRNYYINLCLERNLSKRELLAEIKSNSYERLLNKPKKIEITSLIPKDNVFKNMKNPIVLELNKGESIHSEQDLEITILAKLKSFFGQLGEGFCLVENQYKIAIENINYYIDILLFNLNLNCYVVVELKIRELRKEDKAQMEFYMEAINRQVKKPFHNKTIGIIISKKQNQFIANFVESDCIVPLTYQLK